ncbi:NeuD/PglB/VioB family sugar acetyltransferase [Acidovorax sp. SUPP950]|uniref:NeuD/PglB/VioB family sugar acetyltransferase n=1 Tax=unclassified Acidovorax TaxID=2684926 RepID=UPI0023D376FC|nr:MULTISPECIES: NeuD/PglB/VioB family sugar acetyltransferase [Comamonadaceae]WOI45017.1 NeuD/PglB/VioB family sugar acetyltransferase [Paracidovorax avenae]GKS77951.1 NeuD/PglB/VioB family sugar acetyltransferase [Acidovorax sp. SUPP950]
MAAPCTDTSSPHRNLLIVGAGGFGREVLTYIEDDNPLFRPKGFLDSRTSALNGMQRSIGIVGDPLTYVPEDGDVFMAALGDPMARHKYTEVLRSVHDVDFATVVHPQAHVTRHARLGRGCIIGPRVGISVDVQLGDFVCVQEYTVIGHDVRIGDWCQINSHCSIGGGAKIGNFVSIHPNCVITSGTVIGDHVKVGAGSVVYGRIPPNITIMGNPARRFSWS